MYSLKEEKISQLTPFSVFADNKRIRNKIIEGKSIQDGTPTPEAPAEIQSVGENGTVEIKQTGKNLLNIEEFINDLKNTFSIEETIYNNKNCYQISTSKNTHYYNLSNIEENTQYTIQLNLANTLSDFYLMFVYTDGTKQAISQQQLINNLTKIVVISDVNKTLKQIQISLYSTNKLYIEKDTLSLEKSIEETEYEPYKENIYVIPLSQPLRSLPNGVKDTIEEDGIHRRVGSAVLDGSEDENWNISGKTFYSDYIGNYTRDNFIPMSNCFVGVNTKSGAGDMLIDNTIAFGNAVSYNRFYIKCDSIATVTEFKTWLSENNVELIYELAEEVIEPLTEEQQAVINSMETFEGVNHFSLVGDLEITLTFDYNPQITEEIKKAFKYNITKAYLEVAATDKASGFQINEDNYLQSIDFDDCRYIEGEGVIGSCVAKELQGKFVNVDTSFDIENREVECFIGAETEDNITHYLRLGTFIVQKPENDNVKDNTSFDSLDYMIKFNKEYIHRMAKYLKTEDTDIYPEKQYYILNDSGVYEEVIVPHKEEIGNYYELIDEYTLMKLLKDICNQAGVTLGTFNFRNADYLVHGNRFDSGVSCRDVLKAIAQAAFSWARINEYNELVLDFETSDTITEEIDYNEYYGLNFNDNYGPVNTIVLKNSQAEGENITIKNDDLINSAGGKNLLNISNDYKVTHWKQVPIILPIGEYVITWENIETNGELPSMLMLFNYEDGTSLSRYVSNNYQSKSLSLTAEKNINGVNIYSQTSYANSTDITTTFYNLMISKNGGEYEDFIPLGIKELAISDNPFAYSEETRKSIIKAGEAIYGFKYVPLSVETIGAAYLNCKDKLKIKNMQDGDLETYVFDTRISYQGTLKSNVETLAMTDTETKYRYDGSLTTAQRRTEFRVDKAEQKITSLVKATTEQGKKLTKATQDLEGFERIIEDTTDKTNDRLVKIEEDINGLVTSKSVSGGQNLIKNSVGYFGNDYWQINAETEGKVLTENSTDVKQNSISGSALKLQAETIYQDIKEIKNGEYYLSFNYKKIISTAIATLKVNDLIINLAEQNWKEETRLINVTSNNIKIEMTTDLNSSILITDLMLTEGNLQVSWTQNANESYTDTVQIGKGVRITATGSDTEFVAEAIGITINNTESGTKVAEFTKYGTETQELVAHKDVKIADSLLIQKIGNQTWFSSL